MKISRMASALILLGCVTQVLAHARLLKSDPVDGSTLSAVPTQFVLTFGEPAKLTALSLQKDAEPVQKVAGLPAAAAATITVPAPKLTPGKYVLKWRAVGDDGHILPGKLTFTVASPTAAASVADSPAAALTAATSTL